MSVRLLAVVSITFGFLPLACQCSANTVEEWNQFGGPRRDFSGRPSDVKKDQPTPGNDWSVQAGAGASGAVISGQRVFLMDSVPIPAGTAPKDSATERITALNLANGDKLWEQFYAVTAHKDQEGFDGIVVRPLATPCVANGVVVTLGFTGILSAWSAEDGRLLWQRDLVKDFEATPVQYGFSSSPLFHDGRLFVHVGGRQAAVLCFEPLSGNVLWKSEPDEPSYASPLVWKIHDRLVLVQLTGNALMLIDPQTGSTLLKHPLAKPGLTNVPTPLCLPEDHLLIGGQGNNGTSLLRITPSAGDTGRLVLSASEIWKNSKLSYFYCNWAIEGDTAAGFQGRTMTLFHWRTGKIISQQRDFSDSNVLTLSDRWIVLRGDGLLCRCRAAMTGLETVDRLQITNDRCWTPPTVIDESTILVRTEKSLMRVSLNQLAADAETTTDLNFTSMDAMYGTEPEVISQLVTLIESRGDDGEKTALDQFRALQKSAPLAMNSSTLRKLFRAADSRQYYALSTEILAVWKARQDSSPVLAELETAMLESAGRVSEADRIRQSRLVKVVVKVTVPETTPEKSVITVSGNRPSLGEWQPDRIVLEPTSDRQYEKVLWMAPGTVQLKVTRGSWDTVETQKDGSELRNRQFEIADGTVLNIIVENWLSR